MSRSKFWRTGWDISSLKLKQDPSYRIEKSRLNCDDNGWQTWVPWQSRGRFVFRVYNAYLRSQPPKLGRAAETGWTAVAWQRGIEAVGKRGSVMWKSAGGPKFSWASRLLVITSVSYPRFRSELHAEKARPGPALSICKPSKLKCLIITCRLGGLKPMSWIGLIVRRDCYSVWGWLPRWVQPLTWSDAKKLHVICCD